jgi:hypothetical protein
VGLFVFNPLCCKLNGLLWVYRTSHLLKKIGKRKDDISCRLSEILFDWQAEGEQSREPGDAGD